MGNCHNIPLIPIEEEGVEIKENMLIIDGNQYHTPELINTIRKSRYIPVHREYTKCIGIENYRLDLYINGDGFSLSAF